MASRVRVQFPKADTTAIKAIPPHSRGPGMLAVDQATGLLWQFDEDSAASAGVAVLVPDAGDGRWLAVGTAAGVVALADAGSFTAQTSTEGAIAELYQHLFSEVGGCVPINMHSFREVDGSGDVGAIAANGGILASDTTPIMRADAAESVEISWATGNVDPIATSFMLPPDFDGTADAVLDLIVSSGTTDAATIVVETGWDGGALVSDSTSDTATKSATAHTLAVTIAAADIPDTASRVTIALTPPTHATNAIQLHGARLKYKRKLLTA